MFVILLGGVVWVLWGQGPGGPLRLSVVLVYHYLDFPSMEKIGLEDGMMTTGIMTGMSSLVNLGAKHLTTIYIQSQRLRHLLPRPRRQHLE